VRSVDIEKTPENDMIPLFKNQISRNSIVAYCVALTITIAVLVWVFKLWAADITVPWGYQGDGLLASLLIKGVVDNGWYWQNPYVGMPTGQFLYDYPFLNSLDFITFKIFALFTSNYAVILNGFFLVTFPLTTLTSMIVCRELKFSYISSIVMSVLFTFIPYHIFRGEGHLFLASYYMVPLMILVALWVYLEKDLLFKRGDDNKVTIDIYNKKFLIGIVICFIGASTFTYYPVFTAFFIFIAGFAAFISQKNKSPLIVAFIFIAVIVAGLLLNVAPSVLYQQEHGKNVDVGGRVPWESELYGLKIIQLVLPIYGHRIPFFSYAQQVYSTTSPLVTENAMVSLGMVGSIGLIITFLWLFFKITNESQVKINPDTKFLNGVSLFSISAILLATIGGFGTIINYAIYPQLRAYNRISIFIAFIALLAFFIVVEMTQKKYFTTPTKKNIFCIMLLLVLAGGILDQTHDFMSPPYSIVKSLYQEDQKFFGKIENVMPDKAMIFQLPYVAFPESAPVYNMTDYNHFRGYMNSNKLRWSYGAMRGRPTDAWQKNVANDSPQDMVRNLSNTGFAGIYVNTEGYADFGKNITSNLTSILNTNPIISDDGKLYFFDMTKYNINNELYAKQMLDLKM
jgi:hypothetical protein